MRGCSRRQHGFTLIELLVVLVIAATVVAVVGLRAPVWLEQAQYQAALRDLQGLARRAQSLADRSGRPIVVVWQPQQRRVQALDASLPGIDIPPALELRLAQGPLLAPMSVSAAPYTNAALGQTLWVFTPAGGAGGSSVELLRNGRVQARLVPNWALGTIETWREAAE